MAIAQNKPLVFRDGTSQQQRWKGSLSPGYALVDDRDRDDLFNELRVLAAQIAFYNDQNQLQGDWTTFIPDEKELEQLLDEAQLTQDLSPHVALLIAFLRLFRYAQDDLNQITERHLDFYYQEVLQLKHLPPAPDQVHVLFELARNVDQERQVQGALLKAGKDPVGKTRYYALDKEIVIHQARVSRLMSSIVDAGMGDRIFCAPVADSADGLGAELPDEDRSWAPLGESQFGKAPENRSMSDAEHGFAIVSPALRLGEGERKGTLDLYVKTDLAGDAHGLSDSDLKDAFRLGFSTAKGWFESKLVYTKAGPTPDCIRITWTLSEKDPAVEVLPENFDDLTLLANEPILKVFLNHQAPVYRYGSFSKLQLKHLNFEVTVKGLKNLSLSNDDAKINAEKSFFPLGRYQDLALLFSSGGKS